MKLFIFRNLTRSTWSIRQNGKTINHIPELTLRGPVEFRVQEGGRQRTLREGKKYIHAFVIGLPENLTPGINCDILCLPRVRYNPLRGPNFTLEGEPILSSQGEVYFTREGEVFLRNG